MSNNASEIVIEVSTPGSGDKFFDPLGMTLRGALKLSDVHEKGGTLPSMDIPGMRVGLTISSRKARIFDPLSFPGNQGILDEINNKRGGTLTQPYRACPQKTYKDMTANELATWLYWMQRYVKAGKAFVVQGSARLEGVKVEGGDPTIDNGFDSRFDAPRLLSEFDKLYHTGGNARPRQMVAVEDQKPA